MADDVIGPDAKAAAKTERDHWKRVQIDAGFAGGALSAAAGGAAIAVGVVAAVAAGPVIAALGAVWWASRKLVSVETAVEDPPRPDFREPVIPVALRVFPDGFDFEYSIQSAAFDFLQRVADNVSLVDAIVLANERIDGALLVDESAAVDARTAEADQFIENLTDNAGRLVEEARRLAIELPRDTPQVDRRSRAQTARTPHRRDAGEHAGSGLPCGHGCAAVSCALRPRGLQRRSIGRVGRLTRSGGRVKRAVRGYRERAASQARAAVVDQPQTAT